MKDVVMKAVLQRLGLALTALGMMGGLASCALYRSVSGDKAAAAPPAAVPRAPTTSSAEPAGQRSATPATPFKLGPPERPRDWHHARLQAAHRLVAANPDHTYTGQPPDILLAIPVLSIELNGDGSVRNISVMRYPSQARDTVQKAIAAVRKAAPYGDVSKLPKPWKFNETFLFNDQRKFKPMTLDRI
jgi:hypothetical protein